MQTAPITYTIMAITCVVSYLAFNNNYLREKYLFFPYKIAQDGNYERFITSGFLHADFQHLLFNMLSLYLIGRSVEPWFYAAFESHIPYLVLYLGGIAVASIPDYFTHRGNLYYRALGASGAVSGIVFALIFIDPWDIKLGFFFFPPIIPAVIFGGLYLLFSSYMAKQNRDNIGHTAHFWGGIWGFFFTMTVAIIKRPDLVELFINKLTHPHF